jgi:hypothetical protein
VPSFWGALLVRLVIVGAIIVIVPLATLLLLDVLPLLALVFNLIAYISTADDIVQVTVVPTMPSVALPRWSNAAG